MNQNRYLESYIKEDLNKKMVFVGGPRQVGKTTMSLNVFPTERTYLNWDIIEHKDLILNNEIPNFPNVIFDELHKFKGWRSFIKGFYDLNKNSKKVIVTGSAKLDYYRYGGDSLQGRYHYYRLHPLSLSELQIQTQKDLKDLLFLGGFPEPFFSGSAKDAKRWSLEYRHRLINEDINSLESIHDLAKLELMALRLPDLVGSPLSINSITRDLEISFKVIQRWLIIMERMYAIFRLSPFGSAKIKSVKKEQKHYHYDWSLIEKDGPRFENMIASHLLKWCHFRTDTEGEEYELRYFRDSQAREVDFVITKKDIPSMFIEAKYQSTDIDKNLKYLKSKFPEVDCYQVVFDTDKHYVTKDGIIVISALEFLKKFV